MTDYPVHFMLTFDARHSHAVQTYMWMVVPVRWNAKDESPRKVIYEIDSHTSLNQFYTMMNVLRGKQSRRILVQRVRDVFCSDCGLMYEYRKGNRTGEKTCSECGSTNFTNEHLKNTNNNQTNQRYEQTTTRT